MPDILSTPFLIAAVVAVIAGMVRGFAGFGAAMVMTPIYSALYGPEVGIVLCMLLEIVVALPLLPRAFRHVDWRVIGLLLAAAIVGAPLGNYALTLVAPQPMRWVISAIVLSAVAMLASGWRYSGGPRPAATLASTETAVKVRANLTTYFVFVDLVALSLFFGRDLVGWHTAVQGAFLAPAVILGGLLGEYLFPLASEVFYRRLALALLVAVAIGSLIL
jgi:uncharacterized membrane protein YfcA